MVLFKKGYDGDLLRYLGPEEVKEMIKEVHSGECGEHQAKKKALQMPAADGLLLAYHEKRCGRICKKVSQLSSTSQLGSYPFTKFT